MISAMMSLNNLLQSIWFKLWHPLATKKNTYNMSDTISCWIIQHSPHLQAMLKATSYMEGCHTTFNLKYPRNINEGHIMMINNSCCLCYTVSVSIPCHSDCSIGSGVLTVHWIQAPTFSRHREQTRFHLLAWKKKFLYQTTMVRCKTRQVKFIKVDDKWDFRIFSDLHHWFSTHALTDS